MNINRDNYEEFFILYGDNELGNEDRVRVESFVKENPDLAGEFAMLNQVRFSPDEYVSFENKDALLQGSPGELTAAQELMLLSVDGEISAAGKAELDALLHRDASMRAELELYTKTKADPNERIVFPYKESLYRKEEKARVVPFNWRRLAAAAAILVAVSVTAFIAFNKNDDSSSELANGPAVTRQDSSSKPANQLASAGKDAGAEEPGQQINAGTDTDPQQRSIAAQQTQQDPVESGTAASANKKESSDRSIATNRNVVKDKSVVPAVKTPVVLQKKQEEIAKTHNNLPSPVKNPNVTSPVSDKEMIASVQQPSKEKNVITPEKYTDETVTPRVDDALHLAVNRPADLEDETGDQGSSSKKNKLRGFFRKVTRTFEKTTNIKATDEEDRLLLGGLAIRL